MKYPTLFNIVHGNIVQVQWSIGYRCFRKNHSALCFPQICRLSRISSIPLYQQAGTGSQRCAHFLTGGRISFVASHSTTVGSAIDTIVGAAVHWDGGRKSWRCAIGGNIPSPLPGTARGIIWKYSGPQFCTEEAQCCMINWMIQRDCVLYTE